MQIFTLKKTRPRFCAERRRVLSLLVNAAAPLLAIGSAAAENRVKDEASVIQDFLSVAKRLPGITSDRRRLVISYTRTAGPQDFNTWFLAVWDIGQMKLVMQNVVIAESDANRMRSGKPLLPRTEARIKTVIKWVEAQRLSPLAELMSPSSAEAQAVSVGETEVLRIEKDSLRLIFSRGESRLSLYNIGSSELLFSHGFDSKSSPVPHCAGLRHFPVPHGVWLDDILRVLVIRILYTGSDTCVEPPEEWFVYRLKQK